MSNEPGPISWTAGEIVAAVRTRTVSREEVVRAHLDRITAVDDEVNAFTVTRGEEALAEARRADAAPAERIGMPLDGVPVGVKDLFDVAGLATGEGSVSFAGRIAYRDAALVTRLRDSGAFVLGKGNQPDFAMRWNTVSGHYGYTRNPRDLTASAGGSSGGDAAAVTAGMTTIGVGSDLAGSVRVPAAFCGIYGLRTTPGLVPMDREFPPRHATPAVDGMSTAGPLARSVDDLKLAIQVLAGPDARHPRTLAAPAFDPFPAPPGRVAVVVDECGADVDDDVRAAVDSTAQLLRAAGYRVHSVTVPGIDRAPDLWGELACTELSRAALPQLAPLMEDSCRMHIQELITAFDVAEDLPGYLRRWEEMSALRCAVYTWMSDYQLILAPLAGWAGPPPLRYDHLVGTDQTHRITTAMRNAVWPPLLGLPAVALPNGIQIAARPYREADALAAADAIARSTPPVTIAEPDAA